MCQNKQCVVYLFESCTPDEILDTALRAVITVGGQKCVLGEQFVPNKSFERRDEDKQFI